MPLFRRIRRMRDGGYRFGLSDPERAALRELLPQLRGLLTEAPADDPRLRRLFPTAYPQDPEKDAEYVRYMREELVASRLGALTLVEGVLGSTELTEAELLAVMRALNDIRLVLGTMLDVQEDDPVPDFDDPESGPLLLYHGLGGLLEEIVAALGT